MRAIVRKGVVAASLALAALAVATPAQADPPFTPDADDIVGVGSDTTQFVLNDLAAHYNANGLDGIPGTGDDNPSARLASWDATGPSPITPRAGATPITRPNGSSAGINELRTVGTAVDFARSSRTRAPGDSLPPGSVQVLFVPFAKDDLRYALNASNNAVDLNGDGDTADANEAADTAGTNGPLDLTAAELTDIYECDADGNPATPDLWSDVRAGLPAQQIRPLVPQGGSGTRASFLASIGLTTPGTCVTEVQEHDPLPLNGDPNAIAPFSQGRFNAEVPETGNKIIQLNTSGYLLSRRLFNVVRDTNGGGVTNGGVAAPLQPLFGNNSSLNPAGPRGWLCSPAATSTIAAAGFTQLTAAEQCGRAQ